MVIITRLSGMKKVADTIRGSADPVSTSLSYVVAFFIWCLSNDKKPSHLIAYLQTLTIDDIGVYLMMLFVVIVGHGAFKPAPNTKIHYVTEGK